jgi:voltage-gated potassium channel
MRPAVPILAAFLCAACGPRDQSGPESNIKSAEDAVWWTFATITTVGYGDNFPVTSERRVVAAVLTCSGVRLFGTLSGFLAAWFLGP